MQVRCTGKYYIVTLNAVEIAWFKSLYALMEFITTYSEVKGC